MKRTETTGERLLTKDNDGHVDRAQHAELVGLFEQSILALPTNDEGQYASAGCGGAENRASVCGCFKNSNAHLQKCDRAVALVL